MTKRILILCFLIATITNWVYAQVSYLDYKTKYGTIGFTYPQNWEVAKIPEGKGPFNENSYLQPRGQDFNAQPGQVVIRVFEPVSIMEDTKSLSCQFSLSLFKKFVIQISEDINPAITSITKFGKTFYECVQYNTGFSTKTIGFKSPNGNLYVLAMAEARAISEGNNNILYKVALSLTGGEPSLNLSESETAIKNWYSALSTGNSASLQSLSCSSARQINSFLSIAEGLFGSRSNSEQIILTAATTFNFSNLKFYTVGINGPLAVIRICGNVIRPDSKIESVFNLSRLTGGSNLLILRLEDGKWKVCEPVKKS